MKTMMWALCAFLLSGAVSLGEEKKQQGDAPIVSPTTSVAVTRHLVSDVKKPSWRLVVSVKGNDVTSMRVITTRDEKPMAILVQTRGGGSCYYILPSDNVESIIFQDWGLDLIRQGKDGKSYLDGNRWSWRLKEGEEPKLRRIVGRGTLLWNEKGWSFHEEQSKRLWHRVAMFFPQN